MSQQITPPILAALNHIRSLYPKVVLVVFNSAQRWQYFDEDYNAVKFTMLDVDVGVLEAAADEAYKFGLPAAFEHPDYKGT